MQIDLISKSNPDLKLRPAFAPTTTYEGQVEPVSPEASVFIRTVTEHATARNLAESRAWWPDGGPGMDGRPGDYSEWKSPGFIERVEVRFIWDPAYRFASGTIRAYLFMANDPLARHELPSARYPGAEWEPEHWLFRMSEVPAGLTLRVEWEYAP